MELIIVRHGIAADRETFEGPDADRPLTEKGVEHTREAAGGLKVIGCRPDVIGTSPCARAARTAEIIGEVLAPDVKIEPCRFLAVDPTARKVVRWLRDKEAQTVVIVGHMPRVAEIAAGLLADSAPIEILFKKAAACCLDFESSAALGAARLAWHLQPRHLRALAAAG